MEMSWQDRNSIVAQAADARNEVSNSYGTAPSCPRTLNYLWVLDPFENQFLCQKNIQTFGAHVQGVPRVLEVHPWTPSV